MRDNERDALVAKCRAHVHACEAMRMPATAQLLREVAEALAAQPAEGDGEVVDGFDTWFDEYSKQNYDDYMLARAAWDAALAGK